MELKRFNSEEELSSIRFSCADEALGEVKNLFFRDQLSEEQILLELYSANNGGSSKVDLRRLNIDRVFSKKQIAKKCFLKRCKLVDSVKFQRDYSIQTILTIKSEQRRLETEFKGYYVLLPGSRFSKSNGEPLLFTEVGPGIYYLLNDFLLKDDIQIGFKFQNIFSWIRKKIFSKTSSKS